MKQQLLTVTQTEKVNPDSWYMELSGDMSEIRGAGQFIDIRLPGHYLRRPISIYDFDKRKNTLSILYKVVGSGTEDLSLAKPGDTLDVLLPLGNGFHMATPAERPLLVAGGIGMPPIFLLAKQFAAEGTRVPVILGFNGKDDLLPLDRFRKLGIEPIITTVDGSVGTRGMVTDAMTEFSFDYVFACGPMPMLRAVYDQSKNGQFSFEERMGCGFGACMGCSMKTRYGYKRICKDGPVLDRDEILWQQEGGQNARFER
ncbi:MAG: dihydroorotate dehydrogenase electron transfer subunit [Anaerovoracaceae bacterium]|jgi:dihydroorotate dehydrogenase electron transfer subunit